MQAIVNVISGWRKLFAAFFVGSLLLSGNALADAKTGTPAKLVPLKTEAPKAPPVTPVVVEAPRPTSGCVVVSQNSAMPVDTGQFLPSVYLQSCCGNCGPLSISSLYIPPSSGISSQSQQVICGQ